MTDDAHERRIDLSDLMEQLCARFDVEPCNVKQITITPLRAEVVTYDLVAGRKFAWPDGGVSTTTYVYPVLA